MSHGNPHSHRRAQARAIGAAQPSVNVPLIVQRIDLNGRTLSVAAAGAAVGFGTIALGPLPRGRLMFLARIFDFTITALDQVEVATAWDGDVSVGTAPTADVTLSGAEVNLLASTALGAATSWVSPVVAVDTLTAAIVSNNDGTGEINLNLLVDAANIQDASDSLFRLNGYVEFVYANLGADFP
jgi:hypothetical protein